MEANGFKKRLETAKTNSEKIKLVFQYPDSTRAIIKSGFVIEVFDDGFNFNEIMDGNVTYSYKWIAEIKRDDR